MSQVQVSEDGAAGLAVGGGVRGENGLWPWPRAEVLGVEGLGLVDAGTGGARLDRVPGSGLIALKPPWLPAGFALLGGM